jgi:FtsZ-binding cell division protein ZapB
MSTSPVSAPSASISKSDYLASLPRWRRWLSTLNWRPVVDYEIREIEFEHRRIAHEQRMKQLKKEDERLQKENEQLKKEDERLQKLDARLDELDAKIAALWPSSTSNSIQDRPPASDLQT